MNKYLTKISSNVGRTSRLLAGSAVKDIARTARNATSKLKGYAKDAVGVTHLEHVQEQLDMPKKRWSNLVDKYKLDAKGYRQFRKDSRKKGFTAKAMGSDNLAKWSRGQRDYWRGVGPDSAKYKQVKGLAITGATAYGVAKSGNKLYNKAKELNSPKQPTYY